MQRPKVSHRGLVKTILDAVTISQAAYVWKMQSGLFKTWRGEPAGQIGRPGVPDICGISRSGHFLGIEVKVGRDKQNAAQLEFQARCRAVGANYFVVDEHTDLDGFVNMLKQL